MPYPSPGTFPAPNLGGLTTTRTQLRHGIAQYFGGTYVTGIRGYQGGPLTTYGLVTVRAGFGKRLDWKDMFNRLTPGRGMGAYMVVTLNTDMETRDGNAGAPRTDGNGNIIAGGIKLIKYQCTLECFHLAQVDYAEDAQDDIDALIEAIKQLIRTDRTLGMVGIVTDAGETKFGIRLREDHPGSDDRDRTATHFTIQFEVRVQILA